MLEHLDCGHDKAQWRAAMNSEPLIDRRPAASAFAAYAGAVGMVAVSTLLGLAIAPHWGNSAVDLLYIPAVFGAAILAGLRPALLAALTSALAYNYFFTAPHQSFRVDSPSDLVTIIVLFLVAVVVSQLAASVREQARIAAAHAARNLTIAGLARRLLSCTSEHEIAEVATAELVSVFDSNIVLVSGTPEPAIVASAPGLQVLTPSDIAAAALTLETGEAAGRGLKRVDPASWQFHAVSTEDRIIAAIGFARDDGAPPLASEQLWLLQSLLDQIALALERARLENEARQFATLRERDRVRSALLGSIGHDVTPALKTIGGAVRQLRREGVSDKAQLSAIQSETTKLERYVSNLVEVGPDDEHTPIAAGGVKIDLFQRIVSKDGRDVHLTPKEYAVLAEMAKHPGRVLTHEHLLRTAWGPAQENQTEYLRVAIRALRQKLEERPSKPQLIVNEPAVGYRLMAQ